MSLKVYKTFKKECTKREWAEYEPKILKALEKTWDTERLKIYMFRKEYDEALALLIKDRYPDTYYKGSEILKVAEQLEGKYPEEILAFYKSGLGNFNYAYDRKTYASKAEVMLKVRHMWIDVMKTPKKWEAFARKVKEMNLRRPTFQQEFAKKLPDWETF